MKTPRFIILIVLTAALLIACSSPVPEPEPTSVPTEPPPSTSTPAPTDEPVPTATENPTTVPTETPLPFATPEPSNTPLPEGVLFRDDFNGELQPGWEWQYEKPTNWTLTDDGLLGIVGETESLLIDEYQSNLLWYPLPEGDFVITVKVQGRPFENFHQAAIFIYEDPENYITINHGYCDLPNCAGGEGFYMDYKTGGSWGTYNAPANSEVVYLRLEQNENQIIGYYATEEGEWTRLARFGNFFDFTRVGIGVSNSAAVSSFVGYYDWFEISVP